MAAHSKLTPAVFDRIVEATRMGLKFNDVASYAGVCLTTLGNWRRDGTRQTEGAAARLVAAMSEAEGEAAAEALQRIRSAADLDWRAAAWILERRFNYSARTEIKADVQLSTDDAKERLDRLITQISLRLSSGAVDDTAHAINDGDEI